MFEDGMKRDRILGIPYDTCNTEEALSRVESLFADDKHHLVIHLSLPLIMKARKIQFLRIFLEEADLVIPSGRYVYWAARFLRNHVPDMVDPSMFVKLLMGQAVELNKNVYLLGGRGNTIDRAHENLKRENPRLFVIGRHRIDFSRKEHDDVIQVIGKSAPDYLFIGMGTPQGEYWYEANREKLNAHVTVLVGRLFEIIAGTVRVNRAYKRDHRIHERVRREIPQSGAIRKLWQVPLFVILVLFGRMLRKRKR
jgi:N-acetylglucosaminyldiphosphoundecaprenol N-acetyl-beta-D-mannosaminyltransferase